jgi:phospholipase C
MKLRRIVPEAHRALRAATFSLAGMLLTVGTVYAAATSSPIADPPPVPNLGHPISPISHVIVIIGENRSFDHVFATYKPVQGQTVRNLLSEGIVALDTSMRAIPGPNFEKAHQAAAADLGGSDTFLLSPPQSNFPNNQLPAPLTGGPSGDNGYFSGDNPCNTTPPLSAIDCALKTENGLSGFQDYANLVSGGTGLDSHVPDTRISDVNHLPAGPFQLTNHSTFSYDAYAASPVHRFYQMWQQLNCSALRSTSENPSGCNAQLFSWVEVTVGAGTNGKAQPSNFSTEYSPSATTTGEGSTALGFYNVQQGDATYFKSLADTYAMSDNFHQSVNGGTGANHIMLGHGDAIWFSDASGNPAVPPNNVTVFTEPYNGDANPDKGVVHEIENPNPAKGTNNWYIEDGYGVSDNAGYPPPYKSEPVYGGGSYSNCSDASAPGASEILNYLKSLPRPINPNCEPGHYYLLNNYNPGWFGNSKNAYVDQNPANTPFTIPPSSTRSIGDSLNARNLSWKYYGDQWDNYVGDPYQLNYGSNGPKADEYCNICNPFQYDTSIMSHPDQVAAHIQDTQNLYTDIVGNTLPAVSFVKPSGYVDGHPASSKLDLFEGFVHKIVNQVMASPYKNNTAIFITFDEGGGYYDSGYVQPLDFFGDGTRIPLVVVSKYTQAGHISHEYTDHVSILKFIERNWGLEPVTSRSRDNLPNPVTKGTDPYVPVNSPAIGDLFDLFDFPK